MEKLNPVLREAERLHGHGFAILWLHPKSKIPVGSKWTTGPRKAWENLKREYREGMNVGVRLGSPSELPGGFLAAIDIDIKSAEPRHREEALNAAREYFPEAAFPRVRSGRGFGSRHLYVKTPEPLTPKKLAGSGDLVKVFMPSEERISRREKEKLTEVELKNGWRLRPAWEIALMGEGQQVVLPPSVHPDSGKLYVWRSPLVSVTGIPDLKVRTALNVGHQNGRAVKSAEPKVIRLDGFKPVSVELGWLPISPEVLAGITKGTGVTDRSAYLLKACSALLSAGLNENEVLSVLTDPDLFLGEVAYDHARTTSRERAAQWLSRFTVQGVAWEKDPKNIFGAVPLPAGKASAEEKAEAEEEFARSWKQEVAVTKHGGTSHTLKNLKLIFTHGVKGNVFVEDLFASRTMYGTDTPWGGKENEYIQDIDMLRVKLWLADSEFHFEPSTALLYDATAIVADMNRVHPVRQWLKELKWDGVSRINTWLKDYCQAQAEEPFLSEAGRKFLLAMVRRVFEPGCQWDYVLVLEGGQGKFKSSIARALAGEKWFMDNLPDLKDKDSMLNLQGKWLIELGELADVKRADYNLVKAYLVRRVDTVRPHYGRLKSDVPRQSVFIGTINEGQYLKDPTGNRRYWPVKVGQCDVDALKEVRDQLFAEAMHVYRSTGEKLMLSELAEIQAREAQNERRVDDDESEMREAFLYFRESDAGKVFDFRKFRTHDLMEGPSAPWGRWLTKAGFTVQIASHILTTLGYERHKIRGQRYWKEPGVGRVTQGGRVGQGV